MSEEQKIEIENLKVKIRHLEAEIDDLTEYKSAVQIIIGNHDTW